MGEPSKKHEAESLTRVRIKLARELALSRDPRKADYSRRRAAEEIAHEIGTVLGLVGEARNRMLKTMRNPEYVKVMTLATRAQYLMPLFAKSPRPEHRKTAEKLRTLELTVEGSAWVEKLRRPPGEGRVRRKRGRPDNSHYAATIDDVLIPLIVEEWIDGCLAGEILTPTELVRRFQSLAYGSGTVCSTEARLVKKLSLALAVLGDEVLADV